MDANGFFSFWLDVNKNKVKFNPCSQELVGFEQGTLKEDVLLQGLDALDKQSTDSSGEKEILRQYLSQ